MKIAKICAVVLLGYGIIALLGCASSSGRKDANSLAMLEPQAVLKFSDVPVPSTFKLLPKDSYTFENSGVRVAVLKYCGKVNPDLLVNFYREQMPMYNWNLLNVIEYGDRLMNFERDNETCIIEMAIKGENVTMTISLGPKSSVSPKKSKTPVK